MELNSVFPPTVHLTKVGFLLDSNNNGDGEITYVSYWKFVGQRYLDVEIQNSEPSF